jgi:uncharacterized protein (DUF433 family)
MMPPTTVTVASLLQRITVDRAGEPVVRGWSLGVERILALLERGQPVSAILGAFPGLEASDILACLLYAQRVADSDTAGVVPTPREWAM